MAIFVYMAMQHNPFSGFRHFTLDPYLIMLNVKQCRIKYDFLCIRYDLTGDWAPVSRTIGEHYTHSTYWLILTTYQLL